MITQLSPQLKTHIEKYIDDIEQKKVTESVLSCPLDILADYVEILHMIDVELTHHVDTYYKLAVYLSEKLQGGKMYHLESNDTYWVIDFEFPMQQMNYEQMQKDLIALCPNKHIIIRSINSDMNTRITNIKIEVSN